jgi:hypothetical protein
VLVVSGGQTGVDRAALNAAIAAGVDYGGWCPRGGWAEDHPDPPGLLSPYPGLRETPSPDPAQRTAWNVRDSAATIILRPDPGQGSGLGSGLGPGSGTGPCPDPDPGSGSGGGSAMRRGTTGTDLTLREAAAIGRPRLDIDPSSPRAREDLLAFANGLDASCGQDADGLPRVEPLILNFAGPRESEAPGIYAASRGLVEAFLLEIRGPGSS